MKMAGWLQIVTDIAKAIPKAIADVKRGRRPPPGKPMTSAEMLAKLKALQTHLPALLALFEKYQVGIDDLLEVLRRDGVPWAADLENLLNDLPRDAAELASWLPTIEYALSAFQPAPGKFIGIE